MSIDTLTAVIPCHSLMIIRYCHTWWDVFVFLSHHYGRKCKSTGADDFDDDSWYGRCPDPLQDGLVQSLFVHYIRCTEDLNDSREDWSVGGPCRTEMENIPTGYDVLDPIDRDSECPPVMGIPGMKTTYFCFGPCSSTHVWVRKKSCNCRPCVRSGPKVFTIGRQCENYDVCGPWTKVSVFLGPNHPVTSHSTTHSSTHEGKGVS